MPNGLVLILALIGWLWPLSVAQSDDETARAEASVARMAVGVDALSSRAGLTNQVLAAEFLAIADLHFDVATMARDALGHESFSALSANKRSSYLAAFRDHLAHGFVDAVRQLGASQTEVLGSRIAPSGRIAVIGQSRNGHQRRDIVWFMCHRNPARICDAAVDGVRASARQRAEFGRVFDRAGLEGLTKDLKAGILAERLR